MCGEGDEIQIVVLRQIVLGSFEERDDHLRGAVFLIRSEDVIKFAVFFTCQFVGDTFPGVGRMNGVLPTVGQP